MLAILEFLANLAKLKYHIDMSIQTLCYDTLLCLQFLLIIFEMCLHLI